MDAEKEVLVDVLEPPPEELEPPVELVELDGDDELALELPVGEELPLQAAREAITRSVGIALKTLIALGIRIMVARSGNSWGTPIAGDATNSFLGMTSARHTRARCRQPRYLMISLIPQTGGFASPPRGGFALSRVRHDKCKAPRKPALRREMTQPQRGRRNMQTSGSTQHHHAKPQVRSARGCWFTYPRIC